MIDSKTLGNEPAFPVIPPTGDAQGYPYPSSGITLRQHFAGLAMQGMLASEVRATVEEFTAQAVVIADALLAELAKDQS